MGFLMIRMRPLLVAMVIGGMAAATASAQCVTADLQQSMRTVAPNLPAVAIAWTGATAGILKTDAMTTLRPLYFAVYDSELQSITPDRKVADATIDGAIGLFWTGAEFGLFYQHPNLQLMLQRISSTGVAIGGPIPVGAHRGPLPDDHFAVTWDAVRNGYVVVRTISQTINSGVWVMLTDTSGNVRKELKLTFVMSTFEPRVAVANDGAIAVLYATPNPLSLFLGRISPQGISQGTERISTVAEEWEIGVRDRAFVIVTSRHVSVGGPDRIDWLRVSATGAVTEQTLIEGSSIDLVPVSILWNAQRNEWALAYLDSPVGISNFPPTYRLRRFRDDRSVIADTRFALTSGHGTATTEHPFVWTGKAYASAAELFVSRTQGSDSYLLRHCPLTLSLSGPGGFIRPGDTATLTASVTGGTPGYTYDWRFAETEQDVDGEAVERHRFDRTGTYLVTVTVTDAAGIKTVATTTVTVAIGKRRAI